jgi:hypothetical protein
MLDDIALNVPASLTTLVAGSVEISDRVVRAYTWLNIDREELAGFTLILVYWCTLVLAHYYFETRVLHDRVRAEICIARHRAAALWEERAHLGEAWRSNGHPTTNGTREGHEPSAAASSGGAGTSLAVAVAPASVAGGERAALGGSATSDPVACLLAQATDDLNVTSHGWKRCAMTFLGWESAPELSVLQLLNAADLLAWRQVTDETAISARIVQAQSQLGELAPDQQRVWKSQFATFWRADGQPTPLDAVPPDDRALATWRSRLCAFLGDLYESRQVRNARLSSLQQKASWGVLIALWVLVALVAGGDGRVLLAGAIGGLLSRLTRFSGIRWLTTDFGLGWAQLYLAPPLGALAAWGGIHILVLLQRFGTINVHEVLADGHVQGTGAHAASVLGLALALGFSERLFDRLLRLAADTIVPPAEPQHVSSAPAGVRAL